MAKKEITTDKKKSTTSRKKTLKAVEEPIKVMEVLDVKEDILSNEESKMEEAVDVDNTDSLIEEEVVMITSDEVNERKIVLKTEEIKVEEPKLKATRQKLQLGGYMWNGQCFD